MLNRVTEALEALDLTPRHPVLPGGRSIWGGVLFLLYIPLLVWYLMNSLVPLYGPLPSCCACSTYDTPADSFIYLGNNATCNNDPVCKANVKEQLSLNCDAAVDYEAPLLDTIRVDIALIICAGMDDGSPCTEKCLDVSRRWLNASDYTSDLNRNQALARCPSQIGLCDFKALYESGSTSKFPMSICRYPDLTSILTRLGAGLGLVNGLLVTVRMLARAVWIRVAEKKEDDGKPRDYAAGVIIGIVLNYFSVTYLLVSSTATKRMRYGAQLAVGLLVTFMKTPLVVSLVYLLCQFWAPMMVYSVVSALAYLILFRTLYCMLRLETRSREARNEARKDEEISLINDLPASQITMRKIPTPQQIQTPKEPLLQNNEPTQQAQQQQIEQDQMQTKPKLQTDQIQENLPQQNIQQNTPPSQISHRLRGLLKLYLQQKQQQQPQAHRSINNYGTLNVEGEGEEWPGIPLYPHSVWRYFLLGLLGNVFTFIYMLKLSWQKRHAGFFAGAMCGTSVLMLCLMWTVMYAWGLWPHILFDFPFPVGYPKSTVYFQSAYFTYTTTCVITFVYYLCSFLKARPQHNETLVPGTKYQYRMAFMLSSLPVIAGFMIFFFGFYLPYTNTPLPDNIQDCNFPIYEVFIPFLGVIPGFIVFVFAKVSRVRWGAFAACGFSFLVLSIVLNILIFQYCLGSTPHRRPFYPLVCATELTGSFIVIYGTIRPNRVRHTRVYDDDEPEPIMG